MVLNCIIKIWCCVRNAEKAVKDQSKEEDSFAELRRHHIDQLRILQNYSPEMQEINEIDDVLKETPSQKESYGKQQSKTSTGEISEASVCHLNELSEQQKAETLSQFLSDSVLISGQPGAVAIALQRVFAEEYGNGVPAGSFASEHNSLADQTGASAIQKDG